MAAMISSSVGYTAQDAAETTVTVTPPPAYAAGDLLVMGVIGGGTSATLITASTPSGWTSRGTSGPSVFTKTATSSEPDSYTVTVSAASTIAVFIAAYPAATVVSTAFHASSAGVTSYSPAFPSGVTSGQTVLLIAGAVGGLTDDFWGNQNFNLPASWTTEVPVFGQSNPDNTSDVYPVAIGLADIAGSTSSPTLASAPASQFYACYLVLDITGTSIPQSVTATVAYPNALLGMALTVKALSGAASLAAVLAGDAWQTDFENGTPQLEITPLGSGSYIYGAVTENLGVTGGDSFTALSGTTFSQNIPDDTWDVIYGTLRSTAATTADTPVTLGATGPSAYYTISLAEIPAAPGNSITETATAIASGILPGDFTTTAIAQTAIFASAPAEGSLLVAMVSANSSWGSSYDLGNATVAVEDSSGLTWYPLAERVYPSYSGVWVAYIPGSTAALVVTPSFTAAARTGIAAALSVAVQVAAAAATRDTAALTVSPSFAAAGASSAVTGAAALTVVPSFTLQTGAGTSAALTVSPVFTARRSRTGQSSNNGLLMAAGII
jgi:hypothetical protein